MPKKKKTARKSETHFGASFGAAMAHGMARKSEADIGRAFGAAMAAGMKKGRKTLTASEKKAIAAVKKAITSGAVAKAARLPGKRKRAGKKRAPAAAARRASKPRSKKPATTTAASVLATAQRKALQQWVCEGVRRSGCGAGGTRVVTRSGSFVRLRPPRLLGGR